MVRSGLQVIDGQAKLAQSLDTTTASVQVLARAADLTGTPWERLEGGATRLTRRLSLFATDGSGAAANAIEHLGLNAERLLALPLDQRITEVTEAIRANAAASEQAALFSQLFGDRAFTAFQRIDPSVLAQARSELERFGALVNEQDAGQIERTNDAISMLGLVWRGLSNQLAVAVAPALERTADMMARLAETSGPLGAAIRWLGENVQRVAGYAGAFAAVLAGRLVGKVAAFALGIRGAATAFVLLKRALARLPFVGLVIVLTEAALQFPKLVRGAGSFGEALKLLWEVAIQVWDGIKTSASSLVPALGAIWQDIKAGFFSMLGALTVRWQTFLRTLGTGLDNVPGFGGVADSILSSANTALDQMGALNAAQSSAEGTAIRLRRDAAGRLTAGAQDIAAAWERLGAAVKRGAQTATEELGVTGDAAKRLREEIEAAGGIGGDGEGGDSSGGAAGALGKIGDAARAAGDAMATAARKGGDAWQQTANKLTEVQRKQRASARRLAEDITGPLKSALASGEWSWRSFADAVSQIAQNLATRLINAAFKDRDIAVRGDGREEGVDETELLGILGKMVKQRRESANSYEEAGRLDLAQQERDEIEVIEEFLPRPLDDDEVEAAISDAMDAVGADSIRDMGRVMGVLKQKYTGRMDFASAGPRVKARLSTG
jgi:uncharacterized protein YqeY